MARQGEGDLLSKRCLLLTSVLLVAFAGIAVITQFFDDQASRDFGMISVPEFAHKVHRLAAITNIVDRDLAASPFDGACRRLDLALPPNARIYMEQMLGPTNLDRGLLYHYMAYYLFPREIATSLDQPARITRDGFVGRAAESPKELVDHGFDVEVAAGASTIKGRPLREDLPVRPPASPDWFPSGGDAVIAFLLPLLTALAGVELLRLLFPSLHARLPFLERLGCGLGLGMMAIAAVTLAIKLCGLHGRGLALLLAAAGAGFAVRSNRQAIQSGFVSGAREVAQSPVGLLAVCLFLLAFVSAGVLGLVESDAVAAWMLKAKIMHLYTGSGIVHWFSEPRLAHGHFDYPTLVPALHAATFDSMGRLDEFVTKFWPAWMLLLLTGVLASLNNHPWGRFPAPSFFLLALLLLPCMRLYLESEGGAMPMIFFTTLGFVECMLAQVEGDRQRLGLGLTLCFGGMMAKFEGGIFLAAALVWTLMLRSTRPALTPSRRLWLVAGFCLSVVLPYLCLRAQIPALFYESNWLHEAFRSPWTTLSSMPPMMLMMTARLFLDPGFAAWDAPNGQLHWSGKWNGFTSLYYHPSLGLAWVALALTVALWIAQPARRPSILWMLAVVASIVTGFSFVFSSFVSSTSLSRMLDYYTSDIASCRYLFPVLVAWSASLLTLLFREPTAAASDGAACALHSPDPALANLQDAASRGDNPETPARAV